MLQSASPIGEQAARRRRYKLLGLALILLALALALAASASAFIPRGSSGDGWVKQTSGTAAALYDVSFIDASRGWAVGKGGAIIATADGGASWITQTSGSGATLRGSRR